MKKRILLVLLLIVTMTLSLTSCDAILETLKEKLLENEETIPGVHVHQWGDKLSYDETHHWKVCYKCDETSNKEKHDLSNGVCALCEYSEKSTEGIVYTISEDGTYAIVSGYKGTDADVVIAKTYNGVPVTSIGGSAFRSCSSLTSIVIPDSVTSIGGSAFEYCSSLTSVVIPDNVTSISNYTFYCCTSLTSVVIPDRVTSIASSAFMYCSSLTSVVIPDNVTSISYGAFACCTSLTSVVIPDSVTSIGSGAFNGCSSLNSVVIPDSVTSIDSYAFGSCTSLTDVYYTGTEEEWANITIDNYNSNDDLLNATIHYNYVPEN